MIKIIINGLRCIKLRQKIYNTLISNGETQWTFSSDAIEDDMYSGNWISKDGLNSMTTMVDITTCKEYIALLFIAI